MPDATISLEPIVSYPRTMRAGERYVLSVDLRHSVPPGEWKYPREEYPLTCMLQTGKLFSSEPLGEQTVVLHRFGGTYGPAMFLLQAGSQPGPATFTLVLLNHVGFPVLRLQLDPVRIVSRSETQVPAKQGTVDVRGPVSQDERQSDPLEPSSQAHPPLRWLLLGDLHSTGAPARREFLDAFFSDLTEVGRSAGGLDLLFLTGDLTQSGQPQQFQAADALLSKITHSMEMLVRGERPERQSGRVPVLGVPGNHDHVRVDSLDLLETVQRWEASAEVREAFWTRPEHPLRQAVEFAFSHYTSWSRVRMHGQGINIRKGLLPGDFSATLNVGGTRVGVVGLNSDFLHVVRLDVQQVDLDQRQLVAVCGENLDAWAANHDVTVLLTHHSPAQLSRRGREHFETAIAPPGRFDLHLCGHLHEPTWDPAAPLIGRWQALPFVPGDGMQRKGSHGYSIGVIAKESERVRLTLWSRQLFDRWRRFGPDNRSGLSNSGEPLEVALPGRFSVAATADACTWVVALDGATDSSRAQVALDSLAGESVRIVARLEVGGFQVVTSRAGFQRVLTRVRAGSLELGGARIRWVAEYPRREEPEDTQAGKWGSLPERDHRLLRATILPSEHERWFNARLEVVPTNNQPLVGPVTFYLHESFANVVKKVAAVKGAARLRIKAYGAFTVGAEVDGGRTRLELDLSAVPGLPERFVAGELEWAVRLDLPDTPLVLQEKARSILSWFRTHLTHRGIPVPQRRPRLRVTEEPRSLDEAAWYDGVTATMTITQEELSDEDVLCWKYARHVLRESAREQVPKGNEAIRIVESGLAGFLVSDFKGALFLGGPTRRLHSGRRSKEVSDDSLEETAKSWAALFWELRGLGIEGLGALLFRVWVDPEASKWRTEPAWKFCMEVLKEIERVAPYTLSAARAAFSRRGFPIPEAGLVLIAEIPGGWREGQANFDIRTFREFFQLEPGEPQHVSLWHVASDGHVGAREVRPSVSAKSSNYRLELGAARGRAYPEGDLRPIGVFLRIMTRQFRYCLLMPADPSYMRALKLLEEHGTGTRRKNRMRRVMLGIEEFHRAWPDSPLLAQRNE